MANASTEQRELDLVEKVDFRILNVANNESKLQDMLGRYLAPLLLKAGSEHASVRNKVPTHSYAELVVGCIREATSGHRFAYR